jgi:hypothetical protein
MANYAKALSLLPQTNLSTADEKQKANYTEQITRCLGYTSGGEYHIGRAADREKRAELRAAKMIDELKTNKDHNSSVRTQNLTVAYHSPVLTRPGLSTRLLRWLNFYLMHMAP